MKLRIMTYNIAGGRDFSSYPEKPKYIPESCGAVVKKYAPDVCGLNEVDCGLPRSNKDDLAKVVAGVAGPEYSSFFAKAVHWEPGDYGNAIVSKYPILETKVYPIEDPADRREKNYYETRCILKATIAFPDMTTNVYVTHFGLPRSEKTSAMATLFSILKDETGPCMLMGDFNLVPEDPYIGAITKILTDTFDFSEERNMVTFPSRSVIPCETKADGCKIDYIFVSDHFKVTHVESPSESASDHKPYFVELEY